jgi:hypothetical protein
MKNKNNTKPIDQLFEQAMLEAAKNEKQQLLAELKDEDFQPSEAFQSNIRLLIDEKTKKKKNDVFFAKFISACSRASGFVLLALVIIFLALPKIPAMRNALTSWAMKANPEFVQSYLENNNLQSSTIAREISLNAFQLAPHNPAYLPEGMQLMRFEYNSPDVLYRFRDGTGRYLNIEVLKFGANFNLNTDDQEVRSIENLNGFEAVYSLSQGKSSLIWSDGTYLFMVSTDLSKEEALKVADGLARKNDFRLNY